jgi:hypothetical protein
MLFFRRGPDQPETAQRRREVVVDRFSQIVAAHRRERRQIERDLAKLEAMAAMPMVVPPPPPPFPGDADWQQTPPRSAATDQQGVDVLELAEQVAELRADLRSLVGASVANHETVRNDLLMLRQRYFNMTRHV